MRTPTLSRAMLLALTAALVVVVVVVVVIIGCTRRSSMRVGGAGDPLTPPSTPPSTQPQALTGTLRGGMMGIGGETTGWMLAGDGATGGIELDVSRVKQQADKLEGQRVAVTGMMKDKNYVERGTVRVLVVDEIRPAPAPPAPQR